MFAVVYNQEIFLIVGKKALSSFAQSTLLTGKIHNLPTLDRDEICNSSFNQAFSPEENAFEEYLYEKQYKLVKKNHSTISAYFNFFTRIVW